MDATATATPPATTPATEATTEAGKPPDGQATMAPKDKPAVGSAPPKSPEAISTTEAVGVLSSAIVGAVEEKHEADKQREDKTAARFAALSRREKAAVERERAAKEREAALDAKSQAAGDVERLIAGAKENPGALLERAGLSYADLTEFFLHDGKPGAPALVKATEERLTAKQRELEEKIAAIDKARQDAEQRTQADAAQRAAAQVQADIASHLKAGVDKYELTLALGEDDQVFELMKLEYARSGRVLSIEDAADKIEAFLGEQAKKILSTKKFTAPAAPPPKAPEANGKSASRPAQPAAPTDARAKASTTLTNSKATNPADAAPERRKTREELIADAARTMRDMRHRSASV